MSAIPKPIPRESKKTIGKKRVDLKCPTCGRAFWRYLSQTKAYKLNYCSVTCRSQARGDNRPSNRCRECGETYRIEGWVQADPRRGKYCSRVCYEKVRNRQPARVSFSCGTCGRCFSTPRAWAKRGQAHYCCRTCADIARRRGPRLPRRGSAWKEIAEQVRDRDGRACVRCGFPEEPKRLLSVDHVVPARLLIARPDLADSLDNLASLCSSCHGIKTGLERRLLRGDWMVLESFYGRDAMLAGMDRFAQAQVAS